MHDHDMVAWVAATYGPVAGMVAQGHLTLDLVMSLYAKKQRQYLKQKYQK